MSNSAIPQLIPKLEAHGQVPSIITMRAEGFVDQRQFEAHIHNSIQTARHPLILVFTEVNPSWGEKTFEAINQAEDGYPTRKSYNSSTQVLRVVIIPTDVQDSAEDWWHRTAIGLRGSGDYTPFEETQLNPRVGTTLQFRSGPYRISRTEPDFFIRTKKDELPSFVVESGWSESYNDLLNDMNLLLVGGEGATQAVVILCWSLNHQTRLVSGFAELFVLDGNGIPTRRQYETIFPIPQNPTVPQSLRLSRGEFFGPSLIPDPARRTAPDPNIFLSIDDLRSVALISLERMNIAEAVRNIE